MEKSINIELFFLTLDLIDSLEELIVKMKKSLELELELLEESNTDRNKRKMELVVKEIELTELQIVVSNDEIDEILEEIKLKELDKLINECKDTHPEYIDRLLDVRNKKDRLFQ